MEDFMKIVSINGSPNGKESVTNILVNAFLKGAREAGAETKNIFLSEKRIEYCKGCYTCWFKTPGHCIIKDDMSEVISEMKDANVIILASPLFFNNISGTLKVFIDRLTATGGDPHARDKDSLKKGSNNSVRPKFVMISNCGFPERSQFEVISLWIKKMALLMQTEILCEVYVTQGRQLRTIENQDVRVLNYLKLLEKCGKEIGGNLKLSYETGEQLEKNFI
jgi:putative NADPH-quinone reductase